MLGLLFFEKGDYIMTNASQKSKVWDNHIVDPEAPAGFTFRETYPENPNGVTVLLEQWDAGSFEDAHHHPHDDMSVMVEGEMVVQFYTKNENGELIKDGEEVTFSKGTTGYIDANRIHSVKYTENCKMVYVQDLDFGFISDTE